MEVPGAMLWLNLAADWSGDAALLRWAAPQHVLELGYRVPVGPMVA
jgi:hypothetical protein